MQLYAIDCYILPNYVMNIFANNRVNASNYTTRNAHNYCLPKCIVNELYKSSIAPTVVD